LQIFEFVIQKFYALRKPKTNIQILQQSVLLKYKYTIIFLKEHAKEIYAEVRAAYIDTMNKVSVVFSKKSLATSMLAIILSLVHMHVYYCYLACSNKYV